jgi:hypothetical protein
MKMFARAAEFTSEILGLCGYGEDNNWSVKIADYFFVDCGCCWFWRGALFGGTVATAMIVIITALFHFIRG